MDRIGTTLYPLFQRVSDPSSFPCTPLQPDPDVAVVGAAWPTLPAHLRAAILSIVKGSASATQERMASINFDTLPCVGHARLGDQRRSLLSVFEHFMGSLLVDKSLVMLVFVLVGAWVVSLLLAALVVRWAWNGTLPELFRLPRLQLGHAVKLILLSAILLGGSGSCITIGDPGSSALASPGSSADQE